MNIDKKTLQNILSERADIIKQIHNDYKEAWDNGTKNVVYEHEELEDAFEKVESLDKQLIEFGVSMEEFRSTLTPDAFTQEIKTFTNFNDRFNERASEIKRQIHEEILNNKQWVSLTESVAEVNEWMKDADNGLRALVKADGPLNEYLKIAEEKLEYEKNVLKSVTFDNIRFYNRSVNEFEKTTARNERDSRLKNLEKSQNKQGLNIQERLKERNALIKEAADITEKYQETKEHAKEDKEKVNEIRSRLQKVDNDLIKLNISVDKYFASLTPKLLIEEIDTLINANEKYKEAILSAMEYYNPNNIRSLLSPKEFTAKETAEFCRLTTNGVLDVLKEENLNFKNYINLIEKESIKSLELITDSKQEVSDSISTNILMDDTTCEQLDVKKEEITEGVVFLTKEEIYCNAEENTPECDTRNNDVEER